MDKVYLGLGSNLGDRGKNIQSAMVLLERWGFSIIRSSSIYETEPFGVKDQGWFFNMVLMGETELSPEDLLSAIHSIERALKRVRAEKWGPRTIDIDILLYGDVVMNKQELTIPHPHMHERKTVLQPLAEIAPNALHPALKKTATELLNECSDTSIVNIQQ